MEKTKTVTQIETYHVCDKCRQDFSLFEIYYMSNDYAGSSSKKIVPCKLCKKCMELYKKQHYEKIRVFIELQINTF